DADSFLPHGLDAATVEGFVEACAGEPRVKQAWLARKHLAHTAERPLFVCVVEYRWGKKRAMRMHLSAIVEAMPDLDRKLIFKPDRPTIASKIAAVDGSLIYTRKQVSRPRSGHRWNNRRVLHKGSWGSIASSDATGPTRIDPETASMTRPARVVTEEMF